MRIPACPLWRMFIPMSSAVICSTMRAFSSFPPSIARTPGNFRCEFARELGRVWIITANNDVAVERLVAIQKLSRNIVKGSDYAHSLGYKFRGLLRRRTLPYAERTRGASSNRRRKRNGRIDKDAALLNCRFQFLEKCSLSFEGDRQHQDIGRGASRAVFHS